MYQQLFLYCLLVTLCIFQAWDCLKVDQAFRLHYNNAQLPFTLPCMFIGLFPLCVFLYNPYGTIHMLSGAIVLLSTVWAMNLSMCECPNGKSNPVCCLLLLGGCNYHWNLYIWGLFFRYLLKYRLLSVLSGFKLFFLQKSKNVNLIAVTSVYSCWFL